MRICLLGEFSGDLDEGMRKTSYYLNRELSKDNQVLALDLRSTISKKFWMKLREFRPEIIHYIHGPSAKSFVILRLAALYSRNPKTVMSAMHPLVSSTSKKFVSLFKPDLILTQSQETEETFKKLGFRTKFMPCGVDLEKFKPVEEVQKQRLRDKYGIPKEKFVIAHIGSVKRQRNVQLLEGFQSPETQVFIVGSVSVGVDQDLYEELLKSGCTVRTEYVKNIEEIYQLADCYVFPVTRQNSLFTKKTADCIELPLTVLEALACNIYVITTRFGALPRILKKGQGLFFVEDEQDFFSHLSAVKSGIEVETREKMLPYSWENIAKKIKRTYEEVLTGVAC